MDLRQVIRQRRSVRSFQDRPVDRAVLEDLIREAVWAPSAMNTQPWMFHVVSGNSRDRLCRIMSSAFDRLQPRLAALFKKSMVGMIRRYFTHFGNAPHLVAVTVERLEIPQYQEGAVQSVAAAIQNFSLLAHEAGLGTCWMTGPLWVANEVEAFLGVPQRRLVAVLTVGWPDQDPPTPTRKDEAVAWLE
ncbi:MAG TPA: nitroreductase family protein [Candidatus Aminicenantes bacterium]|nr:nitroreductase family protein [Candidatus Aminicenantes bacterium]